MKIRIVAASILCSLIAGCSDAEPVPESVTVTRGELTIAATPVDEHKGISEVYDAGEQLLVWAEFDLGSGEVFLHELDGESPLAAIVDEDILAAESQSRVIIVCQVRGDRLKDDNAPVGRDRWVPALAAALSSRAADADAHGLDT